MSVCVCVCKQQTESVLCVYLLRVCKKERAKRKISARHALKTVNEAAIVCARERTREMERKCVVRVCVRKRERKREKYLRACMH